ncbi:hypothetical protein ILUMI_07866 [Ignelater luminosus]|uniref:Reverse transcriptase domain-containing protein n=1 Tax=Ignelater luminosus TaxID=2038154 RepID=A0A8K0D2N1_IGNLU|nr:hypothetical protein ILUMI_07866 [Ignelater luminosus]
MYISQPLKSWRKSVAGMGIMIDDSWLTTLLFANDQVVIANDKNDAAYMLRRLTTAYKKLGLNIINMDKTEYLRIREDQEDSELKIKHIKRIKGFKYLGSIISQEETLAKDIQSRLQQGQKCISTLNSFLWSSKIKLKTKMTIYRVIVEPIMTYGSECWRLTPKDKKNVGTTELDFLRRAWLRLNDATHRVFLFDLRQCCDSKDEATGGDEEPLIKGRETLIGNRTSEMNR